VAVVVCNKPLRCSREDRGIRHQLFRNFVYVQQGYFQLGVDQLFCQSPLISTTPKRIMLMRANYRYSNSQPTESPLHTERRTGVGAQPAVAHTPFCTVHTRRRTRRCHLKRLLGPHLFSRSLSAQPRTVRISAHPTEWTPPSTIIPSLIVRLRLEGSIVWDVDTLPFQGPQHMRTPLHVGSEPRSASTIVGPWWSSGGYSPARSVTGATSRGPPRDILRNGFEGLVLEWASSPLPERRDSIYPFCRQFPPPASAARNEGHSQHPHPSTAFPEEIPVRTSLDASAIFPSDVAIRGGKLRMVRQD